MKRKRFLLVAGVDFVNFEIDFGALCELRVKELIAEHKGSFELHFTVFDFQRGTVTTIVVPAFGAGRTDTIDPRFNPITKKDYPGFLKGVPNIINKNVTGKMSITDVYAELIQLGKSSPGELLEWSLICLEDDRLVNSFSDEAIQGNKKAFKKLPEYSRDPEDLEIDFVYDFDPPRMSREERSNLRKAFSKDGYAWIWPGGYDRGGNIDIVVVLLKAPELFDPSLPDEVFVKITLDRKSTYAYGLYFELYGTIPDKELKKIFNAKRSLKSNSFELPLGSIRQYLCTFRNTYAAMLARDIQVPVYATFSPYLARFSKLNDELPVVEFPDAATYTLLKKYLTLKDDKRKGYFVHLPQRTKCKSPQFDEAIFKNRKYAEDFKKTPPPKIVPRELPPFPKPTHPFFRLNEFARHYVFVSGVDYLQQGVDFREKAIHRINVLLKRDDHRDTTLYQILDFTSGSVIFCEVVYTDGTKTVPGFDSSPHNLYAQIRFSIDDLTKFDPVRTDDSMYESDVDSMENQVRYLREFNPRLMHMDFVYGRLIAIGGKAPGTLMEFSFFTHGDETGPKTVNQLTRDQIYSVEQAKISKMTSLEAENETLALELKLRHYFCHDPEANFKSTLFDDVNQELFLKAFHNNTIIWCWGYNQNADLRKLMKALIESKEYNSPGLSDTTLITLKNPTPRVRLFAQRVAGLLSSRSTPPLKVKIPFGNLLYLFADMLKSTYMYHLAAFTDHPVMGPLPGVNILPEVEGAFSLYESDPLDKIFASFYQSHFDIEFDPEKRGYGIYAPDFPWDASNLKGVRIDEKIMDEIQLFPVE